MLVWLIAGALLFLIMFFVCMNVYKTRRLAESIRQLDRSCIDHYDITQEDRDMQESRALGEIKS